MTRDDDPAHDAHRHDRPWTRAILHVDMDAFYASVEVRDHPEYAGKPLIVGGGGRRGVVSAASYEARRFGVKSAMPTAVALRLCPQLINLPVRMSRYAEVSKQVMAIFGRFSPLVEPLSLDEAFLDMTGTQALFGPPVDAAWKIQRAIRDELHLSASVGVAASKFVAKIASDLKKPAGLVVCPPGQERAFLEPLPLERLWGVGPKASERLRALGMGTIGDVARAGEANLTSRFGTLGAHIWRLAMGMDDRPVDPERERQSIGAERTLEHDIRGAIAVRHELLALADEVAASLRKQHLRAGGVRLKLKYADFRTTSRELKTAEPVADAASLIAALDALMPRVDVNRPIRLVGLAATALVDEGAPRQASLFGEPQAKSEKLGRAVDAIDSKFGRGTITRGDAPGRTRS
jgi:DNA polymerase-4